MPVSDRRRQFIEATVKVVGEEGVAKATTRRIAEVADAPAAGMHYAFENKEHLFRAVLEHQLGSGLAIASEVVKPGMGLRAGAEAITRRYANWVRQDPQLQLASYDLILWAIRTPASEHLAARSCRSWVGSTSQLLSETVVPTDPEVNLDDLAALICAAIDGHTLQWQTLGDNSFQPRIEMLVQVIDAWLVAQVDE